MEELLPGAGPELGLLNLKEGQILPIAQTAIMVKGRLGAVFRVMVNGAEVGQDRVGKKSQLQDQGVQGWEYVGVNLRPGVNRIQVEQLDGMGNARQRIRQRDRAGQAGPYRTDGARASDGRWPTRPIASAPDRPRRRARHGPHPGDAECLDRPVAA